MMSTHDTPQLEHQEIVGFKIWYSNSVYTSNDGMWNDAPQDDVQVVMVYFALKDGKGRHTRLYSSGCDYYALAPTGRFTSSFDDINAIEGHPLYGKFMDREDLRLIEQTAFNDWGEWLTPKSLDNLVR